MVDNPDRWHGSALSVTIQGNWQYYRAKIIKYLRQIAVITPYSQFTFAFKSEDASNDIIVDFARRTEKMPEPPKVNKAFITTQNITVQEIIAQCTIVCLPWTFKQRRPSAQDHQCKSHMDTKSELHLPEMQATKHHPKSVDLELVKQLIQKTKYTKLQQFLSKEFDAINAEYAGKPRHLLTNNSQCKDADGLIDSFHLGFGDLQSSNGVAETSGSAVPIQGA